MQNYFSCMFGGEAGYGVMSAGSIVAKAAGRNGLWSFVVNEYPSLIKGGLNTCLVRLAASPLAAYEETLDFLGVISQEAFDQNFRKLKPGSTVLYDQDTVKPPTDGLPPGIRAVACKLVQSGAGDAPKIMSNSALLGAFAALTGFPFDFIADAMKSEFAKPDVYERNLSLAGAVYNQVASEQPGQILFPLLFGEKLPGKMLISGNDAISLGALQAGCKFAAGYPMTPGSSILAYLADHGAEYGLVFKQAEDEIAAVNMLIGAGFAGARAIGATSGGGFALMTEALGFAAQAEVPLVLVNAQRGGPSTGLPTRTMQADLNFVTHASQGEFPRIVMAPGDVAECFYETFRVFNLAEKYQLPCIILTDKFLADSLVTHECFATEGLKIERGKLADEAWLEQNQPYRRYGLTADGVSRRSLPGMKGGRHIATSYTHGEDGFYSSGNREYAADEPSVTAAGIDKLFNKVPFILEDIPAVRLYGPQQADLTVIGWGSTKGAITEAVAEAEQSGLAVNFLQVLYLSPFPAQAVAAVLRTAKKTLLIEGNKTGQLGGMIRCHTGYKADSAYLKYDSRQFVPSMILAKIKEVLS